MRKVVFAINITADGYCNHTDMIADDEILEYFTTLLRDMDVLLFGRKTYELMVPYGPDVARNQSGTQANYEFARLFDSLEQGRILHRIETSWEQQYKNRARKHCGIGARAEAAARERHFRR